MVLKEFLNLSPMEKLEDLLPGIEEFLCTVLAKENLSTEAEQQRQYFLERLDIIKLPPSVPPRPQSLGVRLYPLSSSPPPSIPGDSADRKDDLEDFAAQQRELSRALKDTEASPEPIEAKVYEDIDLADDSITSPPMIQPESQEEEESMYEVPQIHRTFSDSGYEKAADISAISKSTSCESLKIPSTPGRQMPPPLPPRRERTGSNAASRSSIGSILEERTMDLVGRTVGQPPQQEKGSDSRSERSNEDLLDLDMDEIEAMSCDSLDETGSQSQEYVIRLPKPVKKKRSQHRKLGQSMSSLREINQPFRQLEDIMLSGDLHYKSKLTWNRKLVALTNGRLVIYKADKMDTRPSSVILLIGYQATYQKREGKQNFEICIAHNNFESHFFLADFKEWAEAWCEYINASSEGKKPPGPYQHLARGTIIDAIDGNGLSKSGLQSSNSNISIASSDGFDYEPGTVKVKKRDQSGTKVARMGSFAFKATQFFENLGKKASVKKTSSGGSDRSDKSRPLSSATSQSSLCETISPMTPESGIIDLPLEVKRHIEHQGYLNIYSSFNKRKWGKRWCMVQENNFECYRTQTSEVCELEFLLRTCILRRAVEETKSELGLMLMENKREKITIEPMNWTELGSWLRVLMKETATEKTPEGLEGYMDDTNPYHEAVEITRLAGPAPSPSPLVSTAGNDEDKSRLTSHNHGNRDSGNCSSESMDSRFESLERKSGSSKAQPELRRISVDDTGTLYTQVCRKSGTGSRENTFSLQEQTLSDRKSRANSATGSEDERLIFDFDTDNVKLYHREKSLVDEVMSQFQSQIEMGNVPNVEGDSTSDHDVESKPTKASAELSELQHVISPIKSNPVNTVEEEIVIPSEEAEDFMCSSFIEDNTGDISHPQENGANKQLEIRVKENDETKVSDKDTRVVLETGHTDEASVLSPGSHSNHGGLGTRKLSTSTLTPEDICDNLGELRTRLVQLKKDRISIRDRKQKITTETDKVYLEAEYGRLNRECEKVAEEITYMEMLLKSAMNRNSSLNHGHPAKLGKDSEKDVSAAFERMIMELETGNNFGREEDGKDLSSIEEESGSDRESSGLNLCQGDAEEVSGLQVDAKVTLEASAAGDECVQMIPGERGEIACAEQEVNTGDDCLGICSDVENAVENLDEMTVARTEETDSVEVEIIDSCNSVILDAKTDVSINESAICTIENIDKEDDKLNVPSNVEISPESDKTDSELDIANTGDKNRFGKDIDKCVRNGLSDINESAFEEMDTVVKGSLEPSEASEVPSTIDGSDSKDQQDVVPTDYSDNHDIEDEANKGDTDLQNEAKTDSEEVKLGESINALKENAGSQEDQNNSNT